MRWGPRIHDIQVMTEMLWSGESMMESLYNKDSTIPFFSKISIFPWCFGIGLCGKALKHMIFSTKLCVEKVSGGRVFLRAGSMLLFRHDWLDYRYLVMTLGRMGFIQLTPWGHPNWGTYDLHGFWGSQHRLNSNPHQIGQDNSTSKALALDSSWLQSVKKSPATIVSECPALKHQLQKFLIDLWTSPSLAVKPEPWVTKSFIPGT